MNRKGESNSNGGISFLGLLQIVFITLKLLGKISWGWFWVLSPMWIGIAIVIVILIIMGIVYLVSGK